MFRLPRAAGRFILLALALLAFGAPAFPSAAAEAITAYDSAGRLNTDGSIDVTETIDVNAEGNQIRHGIFRDIFTVLRNSDGSKFYAGLNVLSVERDGHAEPYTTSGITNGERIQIGDADRFVDPGPHRYVIHYAMTRMARFFADHDEVFWNATGNFWDFPILKATATISLPQGATISKLVAYTGYVGSQEHAATVTRKSDNVASFTATRQLAPGEGMTYGVAFQKGIVAEAVGPANWLSDHRDTIAPALGVLIVLLYNLFAWNKVGRDPKKGTIIPLFHPPEDMSPALTQWVRRMGFKGAGWDAFTAGIFDLGVKGLVTIDNRDKYLSVAGTGKQATKPLSADEQVLYDYFGGSGSKVLDKSIGTSLNSRRTEMLAAVMKPNRGVYFSNNVPYIVGGIVIGLLALAAMVYLDVLDLGWLLVAAVGGGIIAVLVNILRKGAASAIFGLGFAVLWAGIAGINLIGSLTSLSGLLHAGIAGNLPAIGAVSIIVLTVMFAFIMRAPTVAGRKRMDEIEGFRMYLDTAEKNRLNIEGEPPLTIERFESILPYAIALGVEKPWSDKFTAALAAGAVVGAAGAAYSPLWFSGQNFNSSNLSSNIASISTGMTAAMAAAVPSSSSSSGFSGGGGGGSGGGGGGGGGGGW